LTRYIDDPAAVQAISDLTGELEMTAEDLERQHQIRERAREIWVEHNRPEGRDVEICLAAEREVDIQRRR
jgi:hypothetical protein